MSNYNTKEIIETSLENVVSLKNQLQRIEKMRLEIAEVLARGTKIQSKFLDLGNEVETTANSFLASNYSLLKEEILSFDAKLLNLDTKIDKLDKLDLKTVFTDANRSFSDSLNHLFDSRFKELTVLYENFQSLQGKLTAEIQKLKAIDLETHFQKHDKKLSDIFSSLNSINGTLLSVNEFLIKTQSSISALENVFLTALADQEKNISAKIAETDKKLIDLSSLITSSVKTINSKMDAFNTKFMIVYILLVISLILNVALLLK